MLSVLLDGIAFLGLGTPWKRLLFGSLAGFGGQFIVKPSISYKKDGTAKAFGETLFPWWAWAVVPGIALAVFF